ncbi:UNVERIFIED_CONTAM: hypothetical protein KWD66_14495 [Acinetobacter pittii]
MKAFEFIKDAGIVKSREAVAASANALVQCKDGTTFHVNDLKCLVESLDRVTHRGGLSKTKDHLDYLISFGSEFAGVSKDEIKELQQDVAVHESIYGGD